MIFWILTALLGITISLLGIRIIIKKYFHGEISGRYLLAIIIGFLSFVVYVVLSSIKPEIMSGLVTIAILLPVFVAILVVIYKHQKSSIP